MSDNVRRRVFGDALVFARQLERNTVSKRTGPSFQTKPGTRTRFCAARVAMSKGNQQSIGLHSEGHADQSGQKKKPKGNERGVVKSRLKVQGLRRNKIDAED